MSSNNNFKKQCEELSAILGLDYPVSENVLLKALEDSTYAHNLLVCRDNPEYLEMIFKNTPQLKDGSKEDHHSGISLVKRAAKSLIEWSKTGFSTVSSDIYQKRIDACNSCTSLIDIPKSKKYLYGLTGVDSDKEKICRLCGCVVSIKARRLTDTCPEADPKADGLNKWGEPIPIY